jgi:hypothetical protein
MGHIDGGQSLRQSSYLIDLDQNRIGDASIDPAREARDIGNEKIIPHELAFLAHEIGKYLPAVPIIL